MMALFSGALSTEGQVNPVLDLNGAGEGVEFSNTFTEGTAASCTSTDATLTDEDDSPQLNRLTAELKTDVDGFDVETLDADVTGTNISKSYDTNNGTLTLTGDDTIENYQQVLRTIVYNHTSENPTEGARTVDFEARDTDGHNSNVINATITVVAVNDPPTVEANNGLTLVEGATAQISNTDLDHDDVDNPDSEIFYTLDSSVINGLLRNGLAVLAVTDTFTEADLVGGDITYTHDGSETVSDSFDFTVSDNEVSLGQDSFSITVTPVNDAPTQVVNTGVTVSEGGTVMLTNSELDHDDVDDWDSAIVYTLDSSVINGILRNGLAVLAVTDTFTEADLVAGDITYEHDGSETTTDQFHFTVCDQIDCLAQDIFSISVTAVDDPPMEVTNAGLTVNEGESFVLTNSELEHSDVDSDDVSIVYTLNVAPTRGDLLNGSTTLAAVDTFTEADLVAGGISYVHDGSESTADSFEFTVTGLTAQTFAITVTPVNDAPTQVVNAGVTVAEGGTVMLTSSELDHDDADDADSAIFYTLDLSPFNGTLFNDGVVLSTSDEFTEADLVGGDITYTHDGSETVSDSFDFTVRDDEDGALAQDTFAITITPVNQAAVPTLSMYGVVALTGSLLCVATFLLSKRARKG